MALKQNTTHTLYTLQSFHVTVSTQLLPYNFPKGERNFYHINKLK